MWGQTKIFEPEFFISGGPVLEYKSQQLKIHLLEICWGSFSTSLGNGGGGEGFGENVTKASRGEWSRFSILIFKRKMIEIFSSFFCWLQNVHMCHH